MAGVEHEHGTRLLAVARLWDRCVVAAHTHRLQEAESKRLVSVVHKVVHSVSTLEQYPRLTITDREAGTIHYETDKECIYLLVTAPDFCASFGLPAASSFGLPAASPSLGAMPSATRSARRATLLALWLREVC